MRYQSKNRILRLDYLGVNQARLMAGAECLVVSRLSSYLARNFRYLSRTDQFPASPASGIPAITKLRITISQHGFLKRTVASCTLFCP